MYNERIVVVLLQISEPLLMQNHLTSSVFPYILLKHVGSRLVQNVALDPFQGTALFQDTAFKV